MGQAAVISMSPTQLILHLISYYSNLTLAPVALSEAYTQLGAWQIEADCTVLLQRRKVSSDALEGALELWWTKPNWLTVRLKGQTASQGQGRKKCRHPLALPVSLNIKRLVHPNWKGKNRTPPFEVSELTDFWALSYLGSITKRVRDLFLIQYLLVVSGKNKCLCETCYMR